MCETPFERAHIIETTKASALAPLDTRDSRPRSKNNNRINCNHELQERQAYQKWLNRNSPWDKTEYKRDQSKLKNVAPKKCVNL